MTETKNEQQSHSFKRKLGNTTYTVKVHFTVKQNLPGDPKSADYPYQALKGSF